MLYVILLYVHHITDVHKMQGIILKTCKTRPTYVGRFFL